MRAHAKIDVTIATKNNEETIERCIENIKKYIPYNKIIVVDGGSKDDTVQIAKRLGAHVYFENGLLGEVRYVQATLCNTEWIAVIDSDVFINENWWGEVSKYINNSNIGSINGWLKGSIIDVMPSYEHYTKFVTAKRSRSPIILNGAKYDVTFPFSNTLIRRELILKSKNSLVNVDGGEDNVVSKNVVKWGYKIVNIPKILGLHYHSDPVGHCKMASYRGGKSITIRRGKLRGLRRILTAFTELSTNWIRYSFYSKRFNFRLYGFLLLLYSEEVRGIMHG
jgi:glycosyltransferase involved in cell wall biosynthesis